VVEGRIHVVSADRVVLCAGAIASAHLLLVSGIGPADDLRALGVPVVVDAPGVGAAVSNNPQLVVEWMPSSSPPRPLPPARTDHAGCADRPTHGAASWLAGALHSKGVEVLATARPLA